MRSLPRFVDNRCFGGAGNDLRQGSRPLHRPICLINTISTESADQNGNASWTLRRRPKGVGLTLCAPRRGFVDRCRITLVLNPSTRDFVLASRISFKSSSTADFSGTIGLKRLKTPSSASSSTKPLLRLNKCQVCVCPTLKMLPHLSSTSEPFTSSTSAGCAAAHDTCDANHFQSGECFPSQVLCAWP